IEILKENFFTNQVLFSPDGAHLIVQSVEYTDLAPAGNGAFRAGGTKTQVPVVMNATPLATKPIRNLPSNGTVTSFAWSPDGTRMAYVWYNPDTGIPGPAVPAAGGRARMRQNEYEFKVFVADADGRNPREVYKVKGSNVRA